MLACRPVLSLCGSSSGNYIVAIGAASKSCQEDTIIKCKHHGPCVLQFFGPPLLKYSMSINFSGFAEDTPFGIGHSTVTDFLYLDQFIDLAKSLHLLQKEVFDEA